MSQAGSPKFRHFYRQKPEFDSTQQKYRNDPNKILTNNCQPPQNKWGATKAASRSFANILSFKMKVKFFNLGIQNK